MILSYKFYDSWNLVSKTPSETFKESHQQMVNQLFSISTSLHQIEQEYPIGSDEWTSLNARLTHKINVDTGVRLSDDWRNLIFEEREHICKLGTKIKTDSDLWLVLNTENYKMVSNSVLIRRCNWTLKWYNSKGVLIQEPCIVEYVKMISSAMGVVDGKQVREGAYDRFVYLQANEETLKINRDQRFFIDDIVFRVTKRDTIAHYGLVELSLDEHQVNEEVDDTTNKIADYVIRPPVDSSDVGTTEMFVGEDKISIGTNSQWSIYKKINGEIQSDTYTFSIIGSGAIIIEQTGNVVTLKAGDTLNSIFTLRATNIITSAVINKTIQVSGMW